MIIRKLLSGLKSELKFYKNMVGRQGFTEDIKSLISELMQYGITHGTLADIEEKTTYLLHQPTRPVEFWSL